MLLRVTGLIVLLLAPAAGMYLSGFPDAARNVALGTALASGCEDTGQEAARLAAKALARLLGGPR